MNPQKIILFIPGYYGSTLIDQNSKRLIWGDTKEILLGRKTLALPIPGMTIPGAIDLFPHDLIPDKQILGGLVKEDAYDKTIALLKSIDDNLVFPVAWDWRKDPIEGVRLLDSALKSAQKKYPTSEIILVSHSFGSLVASYYLRYGARDYFEAEETWEGLKHFSKVILSSCPFRGLMAIFRNMHYGIKFGLNHNMQTPLAFCTFESSYFLLPPTGYDAVRDENEKTFFLNLYDPQSWIENKWGFFHHQLSFLNEKNDVRKNYISHFLNRAQKFHQLMDSPLILKPEKLIPILYLSGHGFKTVTKGVWLKNIPESNVFLFYPKNFKKWKSKIDPESVYGDGDATVPDFSLELPEAFKSIETTNVHQKLGHLDSLQHKDSQKIITQFLNEIKITKS
jgi:pimeloyl-ACP methyl ester carboxylesterase